MVRLCGGLADGSAACCFAKGSRPCQPKKGRARCSWCDPDTLEETCGTAGGLARLKQLLRAMPRASQRLALSRLPQAAYENHFEAEFGAFAEEPALPLSEPDSCGDADSEDEIVEGAAAELDIGDFLGRQGMADGFSSDEAVNMEEDQVSSAATDAIDRRDVGRL